MVEVLATYAGLSLDLQRRDGHVLGLARVQLPGGLLRVRRLLRGTASAGSASSARVDVLAPDEFHVPQGSPANRDRVRARGPVLQLHHLLHRRPDELPRGRLARRDRRRLHVTKGKSIAET